MLSAGLAIANAGLSYWNPKDSAQAPKALSALGLYQDITAHRKVLVDNARHYQINTPLWSDGAKADRWVILKPGAAIGFKAKDDYWDFPDSTVFVKNLDIDTIPGDTTSRLHWETQILVLAKEFNPYQGRDIDQWYPFTYKWDADQKDARLIGARTQDDSIRIRPQGRNKAPYMKKWVFTSREQCLMCHRTDQDDTIHGRAISGFFTAQLNLQLTGFPGVNQLDAFFSQGLLRGLKPANWGFQPQWRAIGDSAASLDMRARSYIAANCSNCHGRRGMATGATFGVDLNFDFHNMEAQMEIRHRAVSWPFGLDTLEPLYYPAGSPLIPCDQKTLPVTVGLAVPGLPQKSVILFRQLSRNSRPGDFDSDRNQMPPLSTFEVDVPATDLLAKWILQMSERLPPVHCVTALAGPASHPVPDALLRDGNLILAPQPPRTAVVSMVSPQGRAVPLARIAGGIYALPKGLPKGLYFIRAGAKSILHVIL